MSKKSNLMFWVCVLSTIAAVGIHVYLTNHHYSFKFGQIAGESICNVNDKVNCNTTTASTYSEFFGIPVSIFGGLINFFLLLILISFKFPLVSSKTQEKLAGPIRIISLGIFSVSVIMGFISYVLLSTICPACTGAYIVSFITLVSAWRMTSKSPLFNVADVKLYGGLTAAILGFAFFIHSNQLRAYGGKERLEFTELQFKEWKSYPSKSLVPVSPLTMNASKTAKMKVVEFADFLCGHCANAYPTLHNFMKTHPDVEFSFQAFPLDGECNSEIQYAEGTRCMLARVSHCAGQQDAAWKTQSWIFKNQRSLLSKDKVKEELKQKVAELGLDEQKLMACVDSEETKEIIRNQAKLGAEVGVRGTPALYINGKKVPSGFSIPLLEKIYQELTR